MKKLYTYGDMFGEEPKSSYIRTYIKKIAFIFLKKHFDKLEMRNIDTDQAYLFYNLANDNFIIPDYSGSTKMSVEIEIENFKRSIYKKCAHCQKEIYYKDMHYLGINDVRACAECVPPGTYVKCSNCKRSFLEEDTYIQPRIRGNKVVWGCNGCYTQTNSRIRLGRNWEHSVIGTGKGNIVQSDRGYGVEIECYYTNEDTMAKQLEKLPKTFGINRDGSLDNGIGQTIGKKITRGAFELTTPILRGVQGETYLQNLCTGINHKNNAQVDARCGLHIHVDMANCSRDVDILKRVLIMHWIFEPVIMSFLPHTRRKNEYCRSLKNSYNYKKIAERITLNELHAEWYKGKQNAGRFDHRNNTRYCGINFHEVFTNHNVEIRYHSGTTNAKKILHWVDLHTAIIDYCVTKPEIQELINGGITQFGNQRTLRVLTKKLFELLNTSESTREYFIDRQKKFAKQKGLKEVEFIEKEPLEFEEEDIPNPYQLTREEYSNLLNNPIEV